MNFDLSLFPLINASLNATATVLLVLGYVFIKQRKERLHKWTMLSCFGVSVIFLVCYLTYHYLSGHTTFPDYPPAAVKYFYFALLASHIILAVYVPVGAIITIYYGLRDMRTKHRKWAKVTFPIWLYVSVTGVIVYLMLYQFYPPLETAYFFAGPPCDGVL